MADQPTTVEAVKEWMASILAEHGENSAVEYAETADQEFADLVKVTTQRGEEARWGTRDWEVYRNGAGDLIGVQVYAAATEMQESFYEGVVQALTTETVTTYVPVKEG